MSIKSLIINPGSTSTKIGVFEDEELLFDETLRHTTEEISQYASIVDQKDFRKKIIVDFLASKGIDLKEFQVVVGRGGMLKPIPGGTYPVSDELLNDLKIGKQGQHASNLGGILARELGDEIGVPSYIVDPVVVDELCNLARYSGVPELPRTSVFHALNQKAVAKRYAKEIGKNYNELRLIVVHMGGGVSVGAHENGKVIDVFNALDGDGAFSPERAGGVPAGALIKMCFSGQYTEKEVYKKIVGNGGFNAYLGTNDARVVEDQMKDADKEKAAKAEEVYDAFIYQVCKNIGAQAAVLEGKVDQIIVTGGIAYSKLVIAEFKKRIGWIAPLTVYPGEDELLALAQGALRVMNGEEKAMEY
ncbi:MAG: butyrate kinase [Lachnospiraceae bacterium]|nr:butyrate kinase [Lachnospiraceae bacterium]